MNLADPASGTAAVEGFSIRSVAIPDHQLLRRIGKGSYGEVWLAQNIMGTFRAVKIIYRSTFENKLPFERELAGIKRFEPISRKHEGFVDVLQIGLNDNDGYFYYIMEAADDLERGQEIIPESYVPRTLGKALGKVGRFSVDQCVQTGMALCQALEHLHGHGLVHRDIKPSNIIFINGAPKLADIGLVTDSEHARTFVGTEGFIPPEGPGSMQADIYSLGKALYEIASGRDRLDFPGLPAGLEAFPDREQFLELNEALIRACRQKPEDRYGTAREMYEDLALLASSKSLRRLRTLERRWQSVKRIAIGTAGVAGAIGLIGFPLVREWQHAEEIRERKIGAHSANGIRRLQDGDNIGALAEFSEIFQLEKNNKARFEANQTRVAAILAHSPKLTQMFFLNERVGAVQFSPDGKSIVAAERWGNFFVNDVASGAKLLSTTNWVHLSSAAFTPDGEYLVTGSEGGYFSFWNLTTSTEERIQNGTGVVCLRVSQSGKLVAMGGKDGTIRIWDRISRKFIHDLAGHDGSVRTVDFSPDERLLASGGVDETLRIWDLTKGKPLHSPQKHVSWVVDAVFSPKGDRSATACSDRWAHLWSVETGEEIPSLMRHDGEVNTVRYSPDGSTLLTTSMDGTVKLWDARRTTPLKRNSVLKHSSAVFSANYSEDGRRIVTGCSDGTVRIWDLASSDIGPTDSEGTVNQSGTFSAQVEGGRIRVRSSSQPDASELWSFAVSGNVRAVQLSENGQAVAAWILHKERAAGSINVWTPGKENPSFTFERTSTKGPGLTLSPDGSYLGFRDESSLRLFNAQTGVEWPIPSSLQGDASVAFHPNGKIVALGIGTKVQMFELSSGKMIGTEQTFEGNVSHLTFSPGGQQLLISQTDRYVTPKPAILMDVRDGRTNLSKLWHNDGISSGDFRFDNARVATADEAREGIIWDTKKGAPVLPPLMHGHQVLSISFSQDGRWIGTTSGEKAVQIWDGETGFPITPPLFLDANQTMLRFLPDHRRFVTSDGTQRLWDWQIPTINISPEDAVALSHLLNSDLQRGAHPGSKHIAETWQRLRTRIPEQFEVSPGEIQHWRSRQDSKLADRKIK